MYGHTDMIFFCEVRLLRPERELETQSPTSPLPCHQPLTLRSYAHDGGATPSMPRYDGGDESTSTRQNPTSTPPITRGYDPPNSAILGSASVVAAPSMPMTSEDENITFSYPRAHVQADLSEARQGMGLPQLALPHENPQSSSTKKHRCPYCATEFTRHHNLKSHLLSHTQEKQYVCSTCQSRFRR